jgi:hypothetical protein
MMCPLKRPLAEDCDDDDCEESPPPLQRESGGDLAPRELDMEQHVSFGSAEEDKYVEKGGEEEEEEVVPTQVYVPPDEAAEEEEEGELVQRTPSTTESATPVTEP